MAPPFLDTEALLRVGACGCFLGHGWIAAWKLEYSGWVKFMRAAGFRDSEAQILMPLIGWMDIVLAVITLLRPMELLTAWMVVWAFSTALVRPVSAGLSRAMSPMSDNAIWGFVERASNWVCPLALLTIQKQEGYVPRDITGFGSQVRSPARTPPPASSRAPHTRLAHAPRSRASLPLSRGRGAARPSGRAPQRRPVAGRALQVHGPRLPRRLGGRPPAPGAGRCQAQVRLIPAADPRSRFPSPRRAGSGGGHCHPTRVDAAGTDSPRPAQRPGAPTTRVPGHGTSWQRAASSPDGGRLIVPPPLDMAPPVA